MTMYNPAQITPLISPSPSSTSDSHTSTPSSHVSNDTPQIPLKNDETSVPSISDCNLPTPPPPPTSPSQSPPSSVLPIRRRGTRDRQPPDCYGFRARLSQCLLAKLETEAVPLLTSMIPAQDPESFKEAVKSHNRDEWLEAMKSEINSLISKRVFNLVPLPKGKRAIGCRWAFKTKLKDGQVERRKARLVAKGYLQKKGVDYHETYAPSTRAETM